MENEVVEERTIITSPKDVRNSLTKDLKAKSVPAEITLQKFQFWKP